VVAPENESVSIDDSGCLSGSRGVVWPLTDRDDWCGEWAAVTPPTEDPLPLLTAYEVSELLQLTSGQVTRLAGTGKLHSFVLGNERRFIRRDVIAFVEQRRNPEAPKAPDK
jgi:hypothetical protein